MPSNWKGATATRRGQRRARATAKSRERDALATFVLRDDPRKEAYGVFGIEPDGRIRRFLGRGAPPGLPDIR